VFKLLKSVGVIPDGNRRFAKKYGLDFSEAYMKGFEKVREVIKWASEKDVKDVYFWALSFENFSKRSKTELSILLSLMKKYIDAALNEKTFLDLDCKINFFGNRSVLPKNILDRMSNIESQTKDCSSYNIGVGIAYSGREEIINASRKIAVDVLENKISVNDVNENTFSNYLYTSASPELVIRTGSVSRLSGFMPWQAVYSELYFSKKLWLEFEKRDFFKAVEFFNSTERRFGK
jgi:tritrans,polycis-undecaprenyl-diphosphate synthase [geranylgeranyl-diphosphate specific]